MQSMILFVCSFNDTRGGEERKKKHTKMFVVKKRLEGFFNDAVVEENRSQW